MLLSMPFGCDGLFFVRADLNLRGFAGCLDLSRNVWFSRKSEGRQYCLECVLDTLGIHCAQLVLLRQGSVRPKGGVID